MNEALLGFDARRHLAHPPEWDAARRATYLLRDVPSPMSVDSSVWPSVLGATREWRGANQGLWSDLQQLRTALEPLAAEPHLLVAVSWVSADGFARPSANAGPFLDSTSPATVGDDWRLLGFDVADGGFTSGLSNCGYEPNELDALRATWASDLNDHHLFRDVHRAFAFKQVSEQRVAEHAPFFIFALRIVG